MNSIPSPSKPPLTPSKRGRIQQMVEMGCTYAHISRVMGCSISTVAYTIKRFKTFGSHHDRPKSGRPRRLSERQRRLVLRYVVLNRWKSWREMSGMLKRHSIADISPYQLRRLARTSGLRRYIARSRPDLTKAATNKRREWAQSNVETDWRHIIFTDECSLDSSNLRLKPFVTRLAGTAAEPRNTARSFHSSRKTVMIWAAIAHGKKSDLVRVGGTGCQKVNSARYIDSILNNALRAFVLECELEALQPYKVVEDNAAIHNSRAANAARAAAGIIRTPHPPLSPDLNPIEKAWRLLKSRLRARNLTGATPDRLWTAAQEEWARITPAELDKHIEDMPRRVRIVRSRLGRFSE